MIDSNCPYIYQNLPSLFNLWTDKTIRVNLCKKLRNRTQKEYVYYSMTQLLSHTIAHFTGPSFMFKANNQPNEKISGHAFSWVNIRWVSVVEFHDPTLIIGKVFGQESTVVKWNYQILGLHPVAVRQKLGVILVIKWFKNWSKEKMLFTKKVRLNWYSSMNFFFRKIRMIFDIENSLWKSKIGTFWRTATGWRPKIW